MRAQLNGEDFYCPDLRGWNLMGVDLSEARLQFAYLHDAQLQGARFDTLEFGYAEITGVVNNATVLAAGCTVADDTATCRR